MRRRADVVARARRVRLLVMDVDGVLTDGTMFVTDGGGELKAFHARDGVAIALARRAGLRTALVTGEKSPIAKARADKLGIDRVVAGARRKGDALDEIVLGFELSPAAAAYIGDDLLDVPAMQRAGLAIAVADAAPEVKAVAHVVTRAAGGGGAVREAVELILRAQGVWRRTVAAYIRDHGGLAR
jgi:3-deoxy-D-manno-octulosonate 8-phosphate phosphatase (KDO 8-P phosphatase)